MRDRATTIAGQLCSSAVPHDAGAGRCAGKGNRGLLRAADLNPRPHFVLHGWQRCIFAAREPRCLKRERCCTYAAYPISQTAGSSRALDRSETKGARKRLSKHLMKKYIEGEKDHHRLEKDHHRLTVEGLSYLRALGREIDSRS